MKKPNYKTTIINIKEGETIAENSLDIPTGQKVYVAAVQDKETALRIALFENGAEIHPAISSKLYDGKIGSFKQRGVELAYKGGSTLTVKVQSTKPIAPNQDTEVEVIFLSETEEQCS